MMQLHPILFLGLPPIGADLIKSLSELAQGFR
jgi:hypothetical protein